MILATSKGLKQNVDLLGLDISLSEESLGHSFSSPRDIMDAEKRPLESGSAPLGRRSHLANISKRHGISIWEYEVGGFPSISRRS